MGRDAAAARTRSGSRPVSRTRSVGCRPSGEPGDQRVPEALVGPGDEGGTGSHGSDATSLDAMREARLRHMRHTVCAWLRLLDDGAAGARRGRAGRVVHRRGPGARVHAVGGVAAGGGPGGDRGPCSCSNDVAMASCSPRRARGCCVARSGCWTSSTRPRGTLPRRSRPGRCGSGPSPPPWPGWCPPRWRRCRATWSSACGRAPPRR